MALSKVNDANLRSLIFEYEMIIVMYLAINCPVCKFITPLYLKYSKDPLYKKIIFLQINAAESVVAAKIVGETGNPFFISYKKGFLLRCEEVKTEKKLIQFLKELKSNVRRIL